MYLTLTKPCLSIFLITSDILEEKCQKNFLTWLLLARSLRLQNCAKLIDFIKIIILNADFVARHRKSKSDFTRERSLSFFNVVVFLLNLLRSSLQNELDKFFHTLSNAADVPVRAVTASAFCQARKKLKHQAFIELNARSTEFFYENFDAQRWRGFSLLAVDGSTTQVPKTERNWKYFSGLKPAAGGECPMARLSQMFDVLNNVTVDAMISPYFVSEEILAKQHFKLLKPQDLLLLDRKYPSFWLFSCILAQGGDFCARMAIDKWSVLVGDFMKTGLKEQIVELKPGWAARNKCQQYGLPTTPFKLRLIRVELDTGEIEVLATSLLDMTLYPYELFKDLYHQRWPIEEQYELFKSRIEIANFTGKSVEAVKQDFYARVFMSNLTAMLAFPVHAQITKKYEDAKLDYKINWTQALAKMKISGILLFFRKLPIRIIKKLHELFRENISAVRPGRKYQRKQKVIRKSYPFPYKPIS